MSDGPTPRVQLDMFGEPDASRGEPAETCAGDTPRWIVHPVPKQARARELVRRNLELETRAIEADGLTFERPRTRGDCENGPRPCPWVSCRHHLYLEVTEAGSVQIRHPGKSPHELEHSCALDEAARGGLALRDVGDRLGALEPELVRQVEIRALDTVRVVLQAGEPGPAELILAALWSLVERLGRWVTADELLAELDVPRRDRAGYLSVLRGMVSRREVRRSGPRTDVRYAPVSEG